MREAISNCIMCDKTIFYFYADELSNIGQIESCVVLLS